MINQPLVYIIDLDGTIIGDITPQLLIYDIYNEIKMVDAKMPINVKTIQQNLRAGIIRPHFVEFYHQIRKFQPNAELFIYTASQPKWAEFIIKNIEQAAKIKFNRPILTRKDCVMVNDDISKSLYKIKNKLKGVLRKKYPSTDINNLLTVDNILIIDNNQVFPNSFDKKRLVQCPTYSFKIPENIPALFSLEVFKKHSRLFYNVFHRYNIMLPYTSNYYRFQKYFYQHYVKELDKLEQPHDKFWEMFREVIIRKNIQSFSENNVRFINSIRFL